MEKCVVHAGSCEHTNEPLHSIRQGISWLAKQLLPSQEGPCSMTLNSEYERDFWGALWCCVCVVLL